MPLPGLAGVEEEEALPTQRAGEEEEAPQQNEPEEEWRKKKLQPWPRLGKTTGTRPTCWNKEGERPPKTKSEGVQETGTGYL